jgi:hypothetical protein
MSAFTDVTRSWTWCKQLHEGGNMEYLRKLFVRIEIPSLRRLNERRKKSTAFTILAILVSVAGPVFANTEGRPIDNAHSTMTVYVYKTGILSGLAHNHEIEAPIESGEVNNSERPSVELRVNSGKLRVLDPEVSDGTRAKISFEVALKDGLYQGAAVLKQSGFGITPVKIAGGTVKVKDEIKVVFSIALQR